MKKIISILSVFALVSFANAQVETPAASTSQEIEQTVGLTDVEIEYSRPSMKERKIFGELVPFGEMWRTGANKNTTISFEHDVVVGGKTVKAGKYALYTIPNEGKWEIILYSENENWGVPEKWNDENVVAKVAAEAHKMDMPVETFTISIDDVKANSAVVGLIWENTYVGMPFEVPTNDLVQASIKKTLNNNPKMEDYYKAAVYYLESGNDIKQAKEWIDTAMKMNKEPKFYQLRQQSLIYAAAGDKKGAIALAEKSLKGAQEAGNKDYISMNEKSLKEWSKK